MPGNPLFITRNEPLGQRFESARRLSRYLTKARTRRDCREAPWSLEGSPQPTLGAQGDPQQDFCNLPQPFLFLPLFKVSCDPLIRRLENTTRR